MALPHGRFGSTESIMAARGSILPTSSDSVRARLVALARLAPLALVGSGCVAGEARRAVMLPQPNAAFTAMDGARPDERFALPATEIAGVGPRYFRQEVALTNTRTTLTNGLMRLLMGNMPFHIAHHLYPSIPFHRLPDAHAAMRDRLAVLQRGYADRHAGLVGTLRP
jgi:hypothetical protein